jgi:hypothetical protein
MNISFEKFVFVQVFFMHCGFAMVRSNAAPVHVARWRDRDRFNQRSWPVDTMAGGVTIDRGYEVPNVAVPCSSRWARCVRPLPST